MVVNTEFALDGLDNDKKMADKVFAQQSEVHLEDKASYLFVVEDKEDRKEDMIDEMLPAPEVEEDKGSLMEDNLLKEEHWALAP